MKKIRGVVLLLSSVVSVWSMDSRRVRDKKSAASQNKKMLTLELRFPPITESSEESPASTKHVVSPVSVGSDKVFTFEQPITNCKANTKCLTKPAIDKLKKLWETGKKEPQSPLSSAQLAILIAARTQPQSQEN